MEKRYYEVSAERYLTASEKFPNLMAQATSDRLYEQYEKEVTTVWDVVEKKITETNLCQLDKDELYKLADQFARELAEWINDYNDYLVKWQKPNAVVGLASYGYKYNCYCANSEQEFNRRHKHLSDIKNTLMSYGASQRVGFKTFEELEEELLTKIKLYDYYKETNAYYSKNQTMIGFKNLSDEKAKAIDDVVANTMSLLPISQKQIDTLYDEMRKLKRRMEYVQSNTLLDVSKYEFELLSVSVKEDYKQMRLKIYIVGEDTFEAELKQTMNQCAFKLSHAESCFYCKLDENVNDKLKNAMTSLKDLERRYMQ